MAGYTIRAMAERCGMTAHTLRYYERVGLIEPVGRAENGHRRYTDEDEDWLHFLHTMRATNMPIREMQRYAVLRDGGEQASQERRKILEEHRAKIAAQMDVLRTAHELLSRRMESNGAAAQPAGELKTKATAEAANQLQPMAHAD